MNKNAICDIKIPQLLKVKETLNASSKITTDVSCLLKDSL